MYDMEILVPAETNVPYIRQRLLDFKKYGLMNIGDTKIRLIFVTSPKNDKEILKDGWHENIHVEIHETPYQHVAQRIYYYYSDIAKPNTAKWYFRIDEDSVNDISGIMKNLERDFDYTREYHIGGEFNFAIERIEKEILEKMGYGYWYGINKHFIEYSPAHEYETSITSKAAMDRILNDENAIKYFKTRKQIASGYGDHGLCIAARLCKIYHTVVKFLCKNPEIQLTSIYGGILNHIHYTSRDKSQIYQWFETYEKNEILENRYSDRIYYLELYKPDSNEIRDRKHIRLNSNNLIEIVNDDPKKQDFKPSIFAVWGISRFSHKIIFCYSGKFVEISEDGIGYSIKKEKFALIEIEKRVENNSNPLFTKIMMP